MIRLCAISANRAEYGILSPFLKILQKNQYIDLNFVVTGSHLDKKFGYTVKEIKKDKININKKIKSFPLKDNATSILNSISKSLNEFSYYLLKNKFDIIIILGDRHELIAPCLSALFFNIPIAHISGGDITKGSIDNEIRNFITSIAKIHFVTNFQSMKNVIRIRNSKNAVFNVGSLSAERIINSNFLSTSTLERKNGIKFKKYNLLITFHPITNEDNTNKVYLEEISGLIFEIKFQIVDRGSRIIFSSVFKKKRTGHPKFRLGAPLVEILCTILE